MASFGRSLRIFLADGSPTGVRLAEIINWTGQAIACPRTRFGELKNWPEVSRPGVYVLIEGGLGTDHGRAYIGESEDVYSRLAVHLIEKDFWTEAVAFTSKDTNLTKAHVRYLESRLLEVAKSAARYEIENSNDSNASSLPRADQDAMEEFLVNVRTVLGALGHRILEPIVASQQTGAEVLPIGGAAAPLPAPLMFIFLGLSATGYPTDEGFVVLKDSQMATEHQPSLPKRVRALRETALIDGSVERVGDHYRVIGDMAFTSSSTAAAFVSGSNRSGPISWHTAAGVALKELEEATVTSPPIVA
jgi:hypothetical protein